MDNDRLLGDCAVRAAAMRTLAENIATEEFPSEEPVQLAHALAELAMAMTEYVVSLRNAPAYNPVTEGPLIRTVDGLIKWLVEPLRFVDGAVTSKVPWSLVRPLQSFASRLIPDVVLLLRPKWRYNYSVVLSDLVASVRETVQSTLSADRVDNCLGALHRKVHIISFPYIERRFVLLHAALLHEIGHFIAQDFIVADKSKLPKELFQRIVRGVETDGTILQLYKTKEISKCLAECAELRKRAVQEIGADLVAVHMLGPAALFALDSVVGIRSPDSPPSPDNRRYPPRRMRLRVCLDEISNHLPGLVNWEQLRIVTSKECQDIFARYKTYIEELRQFVSLQSDQEAMKKEAVVDIAYEWLNLSLGDLSTFVRGRCAGKSEVGQDCKWENKKFENGTGFWQTVCNLAHMRLGDGLPPNTLDDTTDSPVPASFEAIMNAGWLYLLSRVQPWPRSGTADSIRDFLNSRHRLERLTLRALEVSELQSRFLKWRARK